MARLQKFDPLVPEAYIPLAFDFADFLGEASIASIKATGIEATKGVDATPGDRLHGTAQTVGQQVVQWIRYPVLGEVYKLKAVIVASDNREWACYASAEVKEQ